MTDHRRRGYNFELDVINHLKTDGYVTIRAAGSKGIIDVLAFKPGQILAVQIKLNGIIGPGDRQELIHIARILDATPIVAWKQGGHKQPLYDQLTGPGPRDRTAFFTDETIKTWRPPP